MKRPRATYVISECPGMDFGVIICNVTADLCYLSMTIFKCGKSFMYLLN